MMSQINTSNLAASVHKYGGDRFEIYGSALEHAVILSYTQALSWNFDIDDIKYNQIKWIYKNM